MQNDWIKNTWAFLATLPVVEFPFEKLPQIYIPERTVLKLPDATHVHPFLWCYLERKTLPPFTEWNATSLSLARVAALPKVIDRLSKWCRFNAARPAKIGQHFRYLSQFLYWADGAEHKSKFERLLSDAELAFEALKGHHTYLRQLVQSHQIGHATAAARDQQAINILSEIHDHVYKDDIEPLSDPKTGSTEAPQEQQVEQFMSTLQAIFDSATRQILRDVDETDEVGTSRRVIRLSATDDTRTVTLSENYSDVRLMELACVAFAGIAIGDSGANLAQMQTYQEPDDLLEQLAQPGRINLTQKEIKFRAGAKPVPVHLTTVTLSRLLTYLQIRSHLVAALNNDDIAPMFVQCRYSAISGLTNCREPISVRPLGGNFLSHLRNKTKSVGAELPQITLRQLRTHKDQVAVRKYGVKVASDMMGHSIATAIRHYCKAQENVRQDEMGQFLKSLTATVLEPACGLPEVVQTVGIAVGSCADHGRPKTIDVQPAAKPDCKKTEGCFFCIQYRVHADEVDLRKLMSCRHVLLRLAPLQGELTAAVRVYVAVVDRIDALLAEIRRRIPQEYERIEQDVLVAGNLSCYWAAKLQQLHLLGMLASAA